LPSELSNTSSTEAWPTGLREPEPLKITSAIESPRRCFAEISPITQRTASMMFDLPQPFGPTTPTRLLGKLIDVGSTNDLNPASLILVRRIVHPRRKGGSREERKCKRKWLASQHRGGCRGMIRRAAATAEEWVYRQRPVCIIPRPSESPECP